jgi:hypothetical protein
VHTGHEADIACPNDRNSHAGRVAEAFLALAWRPSPPGRGATL